MENKTSSQYSLSQPSHWPYHRTSSLSSCSIGLINLKYTTQQAVSLVVPVQWAFLNSNRVLVIHQTQIMYKSWEFLTNQDNKYHILHINGIVFLIVQWNSAAHVWCIRHETQALRNTFSFVTALVCHGNWSCISEARISASCQVNLEM